MLATFSREIKGSFFGTVVKSWDFTPTKFTKTIQKGCMTAKTTNVKQRNYFFEKLTHDASILLAANNGSSCFSITLLRLANDQLFMILQKQLLLGLTGKDTNGWVQRAKSNSFGELQIARTRFNFKYESTSCYFCSIFSFLFFFFFQRNYFISNVFRKSNL